MSFVTVSRQKSFVQTVLTPDTAEIAEREAEIQRRVKQEISKLRETTMAEAQKAGEAVALAAMLPKETRLAQTVAALEQASAQLAAPLAQKEQDLAGLVLEMAFLLARHIAGGESGDARQELAALITPLLQEAATERGARQSIKLRLHPSDVPALESRLNLENILLTADDTIAPGGAMIELLTQNGDPLDRTLWDATLSNRLAALRAALALPGKEAA
ncbi:FliH/SctL family protein [Acidocella sp.]|uniref:FliH/SctL family protein n=1 Tax=Acidocella sp. TaxID=50710 RepID=UPI003D0791F5